MTIAFLTSFYPYISRPENHPIFKRLQDDKVDIVIIATKKSFRNILKELKKYSLLYLFQKTLKKIFFKVFLSFRLYYNKKGYKKENGKKNGRVFIVKNQNSKKCENILKDIKTDLLVLFGTGIIKKHILDIPKFGCIGTHYGMLPKYRGMNVTEWAVFYGDLVGISIFFVNEKIDTGNIIATQEIPIERGDTIKSLREKSNIVSNQLLLQVLKKMIKNNGKISFHPQEINEGKQYFVMHPRLRAIVESKLEVIKSSYL